MAAPVEMLSIDIDGVCYPFPIVSMLDRRKGKPARKQWALVRATEQLLYGIGTSRSTGQFATHLSKCSMEGLVVDRAAVNDGVLKEHELTAGACKLRNEYIYFCVCASFVGYNIVYHVVNSAA